MKLSHTNFVALLLCCVLVLSACTAAPSENSISTDVSSQLSTAESAPNPNSADATDVNTSPVDISKMSDEDIIILVQDVFSCKHMPSDMNWAELLYLSTIPYYDWDSYTLSFLIHSFDIGQCANTQSTSTTIPIANLAVANVSCSDVAQWLSWASACYERTYGTPIFWALCPGETGESGEPALMVHMTHRDESFLYGMTESYDGYVMEVYPDFPAYATPTGSDFELIHENDARLLTVEGSSAKSHLTYCTEILATDSTGRIYVTEDREYHQNRLCVCIPFRSSLDSDELMYIPYKNATLPVFSTEFLDCSNEEHRFLDNWLNPIS